MKKTDKKEHKSDIIKYRLTRKTAAFAAAVLVIAVGLIIAAVYIVGNDGNAAAKNPTDGSETLQEYLDTEDAADYMAAEEATQIEDSQSVIAISWTVPEEYMKTTGAFYVEAGGEISIAVNVIGDQNPVYVGIVTPDGIRRYVYAQGLVMHTFEVEESGYYQMYIRNMTSAEIAAEGSVAYED